MLRSISVWLAWLNGAACLVQCDNQVHFDQLPCDKFHAYVVDSVRDWVGNEVITELPTRWTTIAEDEFEHLFCAGEIPCDTPSAQFHFEYSETVRRSYSISASVSVHLASGFATALITKINGDFEFTGEYQWERATTTTRSTTSEVRPCTKLTLLVQQGLKRSQGTIDHADEKWSWQFACDCPCDGQLVDTFCNRRTGTGSATRTTGIRIKSALAVCPPESCYCVGEK